MDLYNKLLKVAERVKEYKDKLPIWAVPLEGMIDKTLEREQIIKNRTNRVFEALKSQPSKPKPRTGCHNLDVEFNICFLSEKECIGFDVCQDWTKPKKCKGC
jgi:hypothetical protein